MPARGAKHRTPWLVADSGSIRIARAAPARSNASVVVSLRIMHRNRFTHRRRVLALPLLLACPAAVAQATAPVLTITGSRLGPPAQAGRMAFDLGALQQLDQRKIVSATPWYSSASEFSGPLLRDVLKASGAAAGADGSGRLRCTALNDYRVEIPIDDVRRFDVVVAHLFNGKPMSVREKGPLFVIYPFDEQPQLRTTTYYNRCIWQLKAIELL
jgi:hypothetical protein